MRQGRSKLKTLPKSRPMSPWSGQYMPESASVISRPCATCKTRGLAAPAFYILPDGTGRCESCFREQRHR